MDGQEVDVASPADAHPGFVDQWDHKVDAKGRLFLPADVRDAFRDGVVVAPAPDRVLEVFPAAAFAQRQQRLRARPSSNARQRQLVRFFHHNAHRTAVDAQGRIVIPQRLRELAGIDREVVVAGMDDRLEIWDRARHRAQMAEFDGLWELDEPEGDLEGLAW